MMCGERLICPKVSFDHAPVDVRTTALFCCFLQKVVVISRIVRVRAKKGAHPILQNPGDGFYFLYRVRCASVHIVRSPS